MGVQMHEDRYGVVSFSWTPAGTASGPRTAAQTTQMLGLKTTDVIARVEPPSTTASLSVISARCSAADTLEVTFGNFSTGPLTSASGTYRAYIFRAENVQTSVSNALDN